MRQWLSMLFSEAPGEPSIRRVAFGVTVLFVMALCFVGAFRGGLGDGVVTLAVTLVTATTGAVGIGRFAEAMENRGKS